MKVMHSIYALVDPNTGEDRYVGRTGNLLKNRLSVHLSEAKRAGRHDGSEPMTAKSEWILSLIEQGKRPTIRVVRHVAASRVLKQERIWIYRLAKRGAQLLNVVAVPGWYMARRSKAVSP